jgi:hypothetical protein
MAPLILFARPSCPRVVLSRSREARLQSRKLDRNANAEEHISALIALA